MCPIHMYARQLCGMSTVISRGGLCGLAGWHLPGGPVGPMSRWTVDHHVNVEVGQTAYSVDKNGNNGWTQKEGLEQGRRSGALS